MRRTKLIALILILAIILTTLSGCTQQQINESSQELKQSNISPEGYDLDNVTIGKDGVPIPKGFYYVGGSKSTGLVISDHSADKDKGAASTGLKGNQFVWVPLDEISSVSEQITSRLANNSNRSDDIGSDEYKKLQKSVLQYGGFYVSRYEMSKTADGTVTNRPDGTTRIRGVTAQYAKDSSSNMYKNNSSVNSHLIYGSEWDAIMAWFATQGGNWPTYVFDDSNTLGLYKDDNNTYRRFLCLVFNKVDVTVKQGGKDYHYTSELYSTDKDRVKSIMKTFPNTLVEMTEGKIRSAEVDLFYVSTPITKVSSTNTNLRDNDYWVTPADIQETLDYYLAQKEYTDIFVVAPLWGIAHYYGITGNSYYGRSLSIIPLWAGHPDYNSYSTYPEIHYVHEFIHSLERTAFWKGYYEAYEPSPIIHNGNKYGYPAYCTGYLSAELSTKEKEFHMKVFNNTLPEVAGLPRGLPEFVYRTDEIVKEYDYYYNNEWVYGKIEGKMGFDDTGVWGKQRRETYKFNNMTYYDFHTLEEAQKDASKPNKSIKNIYHMAGSLSEITQETHKVMENGAVEVEYNVVRGGSYRNSGTDYTASKRRDYNLSQKGYEYIGFRTCLYITPTEVNAEKEEIKPQWKETGKIAEQRDDVPIPKGYEYVEGKKDTGLTIRDINNKALIFVWVPVDDTTVVKIDNAKKVLAGIYADNKIKIHGSVEGTQEQLGNNNWQYLDKDFTEEIDPKVKESINLYKGFYVSQAELGYEVNHTGKVDNKYSSVPRGMINSYAAVGDYYRGLTEAKNSKLKNENGEPIEIELTYDNMLEIASKAGQEGVTTSHMIYGAEWDAMMVWLMKTGYKSDQKKIIQDSSTIGKYTKTDGENYKFADVYSNNIWGLAGNLAEVTQELRTTDGSYVLRGGAYNHTGNNYPMASRFFSTNETVKNDLKKDNIGFRVTLCIDVGK